MLVLHQDVQSADTCTVNILPCRIHHDGPTKVTKRYWSPSTEGGERGFIIGHSDSLADVES